MTPSVSHDSKQNLFLEVYDMSAETTRCPKRNGEMMQGFIVDFHAVGKRLVSSWFEGAPEKAFWKATNVQEEKCVPVGTVRCSTCGFLESYALSAFAAS